MGFHKLKWTSIESTYRWYSWLLPSKMNIFHLKFSLQQIQQMKN